ncbi:MAG: NUDIX domain-containing protein [Planctomycetes bacterium]|nr:NUDIX domain-containing protein [Planctomycetota bacterium]
MAYHPWLHCPECGGKLVDHDDGESLRPFCAACGRHYYHNPPPVIAVVAVNPAGELLLVRRAVEPAAGKWGLVTGFMELLETPEQAALRELGEESGLQGEILRCLDVLYQPSPRYGSVIVLGYEAAVMGRPSPGSDALDARFFSPADIPALAFSSHDTLVAGYLSGTG